MQLRNALRPHVARAGRMRSLKLSVNLVQVATDSSNSLVVKSNGVRGETGISATTAGARAAATSSTGDVPPHHGNSATNPEDSGSSGETAVPTAAAVGKAKAARGVTRLAMIVATDETDAEAMTVRKSF